MTPEAQRIAIAEVFDGLPPGSYAKNNPGVFKSFEISLDAMHEAEKTLGPKDYESFRWELWSLVKQPLVSEWNRAHLSATAAQRAEAFLRTLNLWTE